MVDPMIAMVEDVVPLLESQVFIPPDVDETIGMDDDDDDDDDNSSPFVLALDSK